MTLGLIIGWIVAAALLSLFFSSLTYSLRDFSRARLGDMLEAKGLSRYLGPTLEHASDLIFVTAVGRLLANILALVGVLRLLHDFGLQLWAQYTLAIVITAMIHVVFSVAFPHAIALHAGEATIATFIRFLHGLRLLLTPVTKLMHAA